MREGSTLIDGRAIAWVVGPLLSGSLTPNPVHEACGGCGALFLMKCVCFLFLALGMQPHASLPALTHLLTD